jgi:hypothetical protein
MKKVLAIVALVAAMFVAGQAQAQISINAGYAPEKFVTGNNTHNNQGFFIGVADNFSLAKGIGVAPGIQFRMNTRNYDGFLGKYKDTQMLIDVPILLNYSIAVNRDLSFTPFVGPMISYAVSGTTKYTAGNSSTSHNWYNDESHLLCDHPTNAFNINLVFGVAAKYNKAKLYAGYRFGLVDQDKTSDNITTKTQGFFVGLGYAL